MCCFFFIGKFPCYPTGKKQNFSSVRHYSKSEGNPVHGQRKQIIHLMVESNELNNQNIQQILHQLMNQQFYSIKSTIPLNQESIDWIIRLPFDHALSMLQILNHIPPTDWQEQVISLRNLPDYEQKRALKINRIHNNDDCYYMEDCRR